MKEKKITDDELNSCLNDLEAEKKRRINLRQESDARILVIRKTYIPKHEDIFILKDGFLDKRFLELVNYCKDDSATVANMMDMICKEKADKTYSFPVFTEEFCGLFVEEVEHFEASDMPKGRPNTMNNYGVLLDELGFYEEFITPLREDYFSHISKLLYPDLGGKDLDSQKAFVVAYKLGCDTDLDFHYDNAEVTINVSLGQNFCEGSLYFGKMRNEAQSEKDMREVIHKHGHGILHRGQHMHGALPIQDGERYNLIIWMRSSKVRNIKCPMCDCKPDLIPVAGFGGGFTTENLDVCGII